MTSRSHLYAVSVALVHMTKIMSISKIIQNVCNMTEITSKVHGIVYVYVRQVVEYYNLPAEDYDMFDNQRHFLSSYD